MFLHFLYNIFIKNSKILQLKTCTADMEPENLRKTATINLTTNLLQNN